MKTVPIREGWCFPPHARHPFTYERTQSRSAAQVPPEWLAGAVAGKGRSCLLFSAMIASQHAQSCWPVWAYWLEGAVTPHYSPTTPSCCGFPSSSIKHRQPQPLSLHPLGAWPGLGCQRPTGRMEAMELVCKLAETENLSSALGQQRNKDKPCITGVLLLWKLEASHKQCNYQLVIAFASPRRRFC